ncbi:MAG: hypothetical protein HY033_04315 [Ignavibacteriae bacterium]|nr:hypothetical protein [Ignavibacteria bacterium]MBI3364112.1 hypothetical protein [Ignavibacteriota bacterium]
MPRWTQWRKIADKRNWYDDDLDWDGPACYELGIGGPRSKNPRVVYVGETGNEQKRISAYARSGSHLSRIIDWHLKQGWRLYYRAQIKQSKRVAMTTEYNRLASFKYDWNRKLNWE